MDRPRRPDAINPSPKEDAATVKAAEVSVTARRQWRRLLEHRYSTSSVNKPFGSGNGIGQGRDFGKGSKDGAGGKSTAFSNYPIL
jgi:hypothetical protein